MAAQVLTTSPETFVRLTAATRSLIVTEENSRRGDQIALRPATSVGNAGERYLAFAVARPGSVGEAAKLLAAEPGARFLAGGTLLMRVANEDDGRLTRLVLADRLGLSGIDVNGSRATLGAAVSMAAVAAHPRLEFLAPVADSIGGPAVRNMATVGGNLFARAPYGDFAVALLALGASIIVSDGKRGETIDLERFLAGRTISTSGIVTGIAFDLPPAGTFRFVKAIRKKPHGAAVVSIAALLPASDGRIRSARVAYGAMAPTAMRARAVEAALEGKALNDSAISTAVAVATEGCAPADDAIASAWYRSAVLPVHLRRLLSGA